MNVITFIQENFTILLLIGLWIYLLSVCKHAQLPYHRFVLGSVGLFTILLYYLKPILTTYLARLVIILTGICGKLFHIYQVFPQHGMIFVNSKVGSISLYVDYECAGLIEIVVFISLIAFFPLFKNREKLITMLFGTLWIIMSNVIRIMTICFIIHMFGVNSYYLAHTIIGRLVFCVLSILLYFIVFTRKQITRQKVGNFNYATNVEK